MNIDLCQELSQNFLDFSAEANIQRAFADVRDGLKPGQRACLWEMYNKGYTSNKPHVKSAKISGGTIASWWPHSSTAVYETFARMSQSWINNIPEVDWHGANGSIQISGDPASDRYTEARLSTASEQGLLLNIKKNNVEMRPNFSEDDYWPTVFPAIYPRLLVNGCQGIGSTIANTWLPHALDEIASVICNYVEQGTIDYSSLAPSFPTGGIITNRKDLSEIYKTGKGKVTVRCRAEIKDNCILITEIPYQVYIEPLLDKIRQLILKDEITGISNIVNKSNRDSLLIEVECYEEPQSVLNQLYLKTDLQKDFSANCYALLGKTPKLFTFEEYLNVFLNHNYECIQKEHKFDLDKSEKRLEIVSGLLIALEDIDNVIKLIKKSESAAKAMIELQKHYGLSEAQSKAIVDMKLGRLAHLEKLELEKEAAELKEKIAYCKEVIENLSKQKEIYLTRFKEFVKKFPSPRKTELADIAKITKKELKKEVVEVEPEKCVVTMTDTGLIKRIPLTNFKTQKRNGTGMKLTGEVTIRTNTVDTLIVLTNKGKLYRFKVNDVPSGTNTSPGVSIYTLLKMEPGEVATLIYSIYKDTDKKFIFFATAFGACKKVPLSDFTGPARKNGSMAIKLSAGDSLVSTVLMSDEDIILFSEKGKAIRFSSSEISPSSKTSMGVRGMNLDEGDKIVTCLPIRNMEDSVGIFCVDGTGKKIELTELMPQKRGGKGVKISSNKNVAGAAMLSDEDEVLLIGKSNSICIKSKDIPMRKKSSDGVALLKNGNLVSVTKI